jgi:hypothetical protein
MKLVDGFELKVVGMRRIDEDFGVVGDIISISIVDLGDTSSWIPSFSITLNHGKYFA